MLTSCDFSVLQRPDSPVVLTGSELATVESVPTGLIGTDVRQIVAFKHTRDANGPHWAQIPVQIDERKVVDFGTLPASNTVAGTVGTVFGTSASGIAEVQYADPTTYVGADGDLLAPNGQTAFDANDELVFMAADAGGQPREDGVTEPAGVIAGSGVAVHVLDSYETVTSPEYGVLPRLGTVYLFRADPGATPVLHPGAAKDYVTYTFRRDLLVGGTMTHPPYIGATPAESYQRVNVVANYPANHNNESSSVQTETYRAAFSNRWHERGWSIRNGASWGPDILENHRNNAVWGNGCFRNSATFAGRDTGQGAFVANIDGPVRAIRSYIGANSGPYTQRTHLFYRDREQVLTNLRVHTMPPLGDYLDLDSGIVDDNMTYLNSKMSSSPVPIDNGVQDAVPTGVPSWELIEGDAGSVMTAHRLHSTILPPPEQGGIDAVATRIWDDEGTSDRCGSDDGQATGMNGVQLNASGLIPNTDPRPSIIAQYGNVLVPLTSERINRFAAPGATKEEAEAWAAEIDHPLTFAVKTYTLP